MNVASGRVIGSLKSRHRSQEFLAFLSQIERTVPAGLHVPLIVHNYATHKTAGVALAQSPSLGVLSRPLRVFRPSRAEPGGYRRPT